MWGINESLRNLFLDLKESAARQQDWSIKREAVCPMLSPGQPQRCVLTCRPFSLQTDVVKAPGYAASTVHAVVFFRAYDIADGQAHGDPTAAVYSGNERCHPHPLDVHCSIRAAKSNIHARSHVQRLRDVGPGFLRKCSHKEG